MKKKDEYKRVGTPMLPAVFGFDMTKHQIIIYCVPAAIAILPGFLWIRIYYNCSHIKSRLDHP
ncbi:hypothetical protein [Virgibacillus sp. YIM 98842]|uniref:hypothetical protein n=1 Tax=Virgibacillus sp. YIM 98842 TaxID=2663533 RepID=UPI001F09BDB5|nr:hypothetical protein [Virgibacillus sp. YIM 98842]